MEFLLLLLLPLFALPGGGSDAESEGAEGLAEDDGAKSAAAYSTETAGVTTRSDWLDLSEDPDIVDGLKGHDRIKGNGGDDTLSGGSGRDSLYGDDGDDLLSGGRDADLISGDQGNDSYGSVLGEAGNDRVYGAGGEDLLLDGLGHDSLFGGDGNDTLSAVLPGPDSAADVLDGGDGADILRCNNGDTLSGGLKDDTFVVYPGGDPVVITDFTTEAMADDPASNGDLLLILTPTDQSINLQDHISHRLADNGIDREVLLGSKVVAILQGPVTGLAAIETSSGDQSLLGWGKAGVDIMRGTGSADHLHGLGGNDQITARGGDDFVTDGEGDDLIHLGAGNDEFLGAEWSFNGPDLDDIRGGKGDDLLQSQYGSDTLHGDAGNDVLTAYDTPGQTGATGDYLSGGTGDDRLSGDAGDTLAGNEGADVFHAGPDGLVTVEDFQPAADSLLLQVGASAAISLSLSGSSDTLVTVDGTPMVMLRGILPADIPAASVRAA